MMHNDGIVVTIVNNEKKPIREHDFTKNGERNRKCKILLPFSSEYQVLVKNTNDRRIKLDIEIDGAVVSGTGIVVDKNSNLYIERFINVDKKFKFVKPNSDGVADPTNIENGLVKVRVVQEKTYYHAIPTVIEKHIHHWDNYWFPNRYYYPTIWYGSSQPSISDWPKDLTGGTIGGILADGTNYHHMNASFSSDASTTLDSNLVGSQSSIKPLNAIQPIGEVGATVEGGKSDQVFSTTHWNGDLGEASIFTFQLLGMKEQDNKEYEEYLKLKKKFEG